MLARKQLEREQRRAATGRAGILEPPPQQLFLLAEAELADRAVGGGALAEVVRAGRLLEVVGPGRAQLREIAFVPAFGESVCLDPGLGEAQVRTDVPSTSDAEREPGPT
jgi:hypothetical protein